MGGYPTGGNVAIAAGVTTGTFSVSVNGDTTLEPDETFTVYISTPSGYVAGTTTSATGTILNDDVAPATPAISVNAGNAQNTIGFVDGGAGSSPITAHKVYRSLSANGTYGLLATVPVANTTFADNNLTNGTTYYYKATAVNAAGESAQSDTVSGQPTGGAALTANQQLLAAMPARPLVAVLGGSRERQQGIASGTQTRSMPSGDLVWAEMMDPRLFRTTFAYSAGSDANSFGLTGMLFAADGEGAWSAYQRIPALLGSDADVALVAMSSNTVQFGNYDIYHSDLGTTFR